MVAQDDTGEIWTYSNKDVRAQNNITAGRVLKEDQLVDHSKLKEPTNSYLYRGFGKPLDNNDTTHVPDLFADKEPCEDSEEWFAECVEDIKKNGRFTGKLNRKHMMFFYYDMQELENIKKDYGLIKELQEKLAFLHKIVDGFLHEGDCSKCNWNYVGNWSPPNEDVQGICSMCFNEHKESIKDLPKPLPVEDDGVIFSAASNPSLPYPCSKEHQEFVDKVCHEWLEFNKPRSMEVNVSESMFMTLYNVTRRTMLRNEQFALKVAEDLKNCKLNNRDQDEELNLDDAQPSP